MCVSESWSAGTRNFAWSPAWYHAGVARGHAATHVTRSTLVEHNKFSIYILRNAQKAFVRYQYVCFAFECELSGANISGLENDF